MISTISAVSYASERKMAVKHVYDRIVDNKRPWVCMILHILNAALILAKYIDNKRFWTTADLVDQLLQIFIGIDG